MIKDRSLKIKAARLITLTEKRHHIRPAPCMPHLLFVYVGKNFKLLLIVYAFLHSWTTLYFRERLKEFKRKRLLRSSCYSLGQPEILEQVAIIHLIIRLYLCAFKICCYFILSARIVALRAWTLQAFLHCQSDFQQIRKMRHWKVKLLLLYIVPSITRSISRSVWGVINSSCLRTSQSSTHMRDDWMDLCFNCCYIKLLRHLERAAI